MFSLPPGLASSQRQQVPRLKHALDMQSSAVTCPPPPPPPAPPPQSLAPIPLQAFYHNHPRNRVAERVWILFKLAPRGHLAFPQEIPVKPWVKSAPQPLWLFGFWSAFSLLCGSLKAGTVKNQSFPELPLPCLTDQHLQETEHGG